MPARGRKVSTSNLPPVRATASSPLGRNVTYAQSMPIALCVNMSPKSSLVLSGLPRSPLARRAPTLTREPNAASPPARTRKRARCLVTTFSS